MHKFTKFKKSKGQFFLIGAVMVTSILFTVYNVFLGYFAIDTSEVQLREEGHIASNIEKLSRGKFNELDSGDITCDEYSDNIETFEIFTEEQTLERGIFLDYKASIENGCLWTNFTVDMSSKQVNLLKKWDMSIDFSPFNYVMDSDNDWSGSSPHVTEVDRFNIVTSDGAVHLQNNAEDGRVVYQFDSCHEAGSPECEEAVWYDNEPIGNSPGNSILSFRYATNESGRFEFQDDIDDTGDSRYFQMEIVMNRTDLSNEVNVTKTDISFATIP